LGNAGGNIKWLSCSAQQYSSLKIIELLYDPAVPLLDIYTKDLKAGEYLDTNGRIMHKS
jgi:hypothetical protein